MRIALADMLLREDPQGVDEYAESGNLPQERPTAPLQTYQDAAKVLGLVDMLFFSGWAHEEMERLDGAEQIDSGVDLLKIAGEGTDEKFIGMVIHLAPEREDGPCEYIITCLHRDPRWVGLNPQLPYCRGLDVHILGRPGRPEAVIALPPGTLRMGSPAEPRDDMGLAIRETVMWHGASACFQEEPGRGPEGES